MDNELFQLPLSYQVHRLWGDLPPTADSFAAASVENISRFELAKIVTLINLTYWI